MIGYEKPLGCPLKYLFEQKQREFTAQSLNDSLLVFFGGDLKSTLEKSLEQLLLVYKCIRSSPKMDFTFDG